MGTNWLTNINPVFEDLDDVRMKELYEKYNYCKYGHYEEFDVGDSRWPECMAERLDLFPLEDFSDLDCHPDCGPVVIDEGNRHAHQNVDGMCWHDEPIVMPEDCCE